MNCAIITPWNSYCKSPRFPVLVTIRGRRPGFIAEERGSKDAWIQERILAIHRLHPYYGYTGMTTALRREGMVVNRKRVRRLMRGLGIRSVIRKKRPLPAESIHPLSEPVESRVYRRGSVTSSRNGYYLRSNGELLCLPVGSTRFV